MENNIALSFCIPTYNNRDSAKRLVLSILEYSGTDIEVVVLDNGSTDGTLKILNDIIDQRLNIYSNGINKGALFNMLNVLDKGNGKYLVYCTDHDHVDSEKIEKFKNFLVDSNAVALGYCEYDSEGEPLFDLYKSGYDALSKFAYTTRHPTGFFFKREFWKSRDCVNRFSDFELVDLFPLEFVFAELSLLGDGVVYFESLFSPERGARVTKHKSATTNGKSKSAFFSPQTRLKMATNFERHLRTLNISKKELEQLTVDSFFRELNAATFGYKQIMLNDAICEHYYMEKRQVSYLELVKLAFDFYTGYKNNVIKKRYKSVVDRTKFKLILGSIIVKKIIKKL